MPAELATRRAAPTILQFLARYPKPTPRPKRVGPKCGELSRSAVARGYAVAFQAAILRRKVLASLTESPTLDLFTVPKVSTPKLGIDLAVRGIEVRKLFYAAFARGLVKDGYDPEEALQEVYKGLLARNLGKCPFDARKSSFGHYVHIVTKCVLANYVRKERRRASFESNESALGASRLEGIYSVESAEDTKNSLDPGAVRALSRSVRVEGPTEEALNLLVAGYSKREVAERLGVEARWLDGVLVSVRATLVG